MLKQVMTALFGASFCVGACANDVFLDANPDTAHARIDATHNSRKLILSGAVVITSDHGNLASVAAFTHSRLSNDSPVHGGFGAKAFAVDPKGDSFVALAGGGNLGFDFPNVRGLSLNAELFYAPGVTITSDIDSLVDLTIDVQYALFENGGVYAGMRNLQADTKNGDYKFDDDLHVGIHFSF